MQAREHESEALGDIILMAYDGVGANDFLNNSGVGGGIAADGDGLAIFAKRFAKQRAALGGGGGGDGTGVDDHEVSLAVLDRRVATVAKQFLDLHAFVVVDFTTKGQQPIRWHKGIVTAPKESILLCRKLFRIGGQMLIYANCRPVGWRGFRGLRKEIRRIFAAFGYISLKREFA